MLAGSFGYRVPDLVASAIGGGAEGGATATTPAAGPATGGPFATGKPPVFTVTASGGAVTVTQWPTAGSNPGGGGGGGGGGGQGGGRNDTGLIIAGVLAGLAGVAAGYLGYCAWLYRRQVRAYRSHLAVANRYSPAPGASTGMLAGGLGVGRKGSRRAQEEGGEGVVSEKGGEREADKGKQRASVPVPAPSRFSMSTVDSMSMGWAVPPTEPRYLFDEDRPSPGSGGTGSASGFGSGSGSGTTPGTGTTRPLRRSESISGGSTSSTERLLEGQEPSFFSVVLGPRRALRVVNGLESDRESGGE